MRTKARFDFCSACFIYFSVCIYLSSLEDLRSPSGSQNGSVADNVLKSWPNPGLLTKGISPFKQKPKLRIHQKPCDLLVSARQENLYFSTRTSTAEVKGHPVPN